MTGDQRELTDTIADNLAPLKPALRGWLHAGTLPLACAAGLVLIILAPTRAARTAAVVFGSASILLFGISALYHRLHWRSRAKGLLRRLDHANIFVMIAGTYTPFAVLLLRGTDRTTLLIAAWAGAALGVMFRLLWVAAPRWLYTPIYLALGWVAIFWLPAFYHRGGGIAVALLIAGGILYSLGAIVYGLKKPNPSPHWFGFHEIFHACTVAAFVTHYIAASIITYQSA
ncbi:hemolysin III family protein [Kribbella sp. NPDC026611]|uniref:PAQR family membrane homeostasis protein TrhA n=1 Tax=Kribbella sp. NPDC026611 TaxID=3154911 RepID=UPI0033E9002D